MSLKSDQIASENLKCREIVKSILDSGISQRQLYFILYLLSFNLENIEHMQDLTLILKSMNENALVMDQSSESEG